MRIPPPPAGAVPYDEPRARRGGRPRRGLQAESDPADPLNPLLAAGVTVTNAYRTEGDVADLVRRGYTPNLSPEAPHNLGDGVDLTPGNSGWSLDELERQARQTFIQAGYQPREAAIHNGNHVHLDVPGWGGGLPAPPGGAVLLGSEPIAPVARPAPLLPATVSPEAQAEARAGVDFLTGGQAAPPPMPGPFDRFAGNFPDRPLPVAVLPDEGEARVPGEVTDTGKGSGLTRLDPAKLARFQAAFEDKRNGKAELMAISSSLGFPNWDNAAMSRLDAALRHRAKGTPVRWVPNTNDVVRRPEPLQQQQGQSNEDFFRETHPAQGTIAPIPFVPPDQRPIPQKIEDAATFLGMRDAKARQVARDSSFVPLLGGAIAVEEGVGEIGKGNLASGVALTALGGLDAFGMGRGKAAREAGKQAIEEAAQIASRSPDRRLTGYADFVPQERGPSLVGRPPASGVAPANVGRDGRIYVGDAGSAHFSVTEKYRDVEFTGETGFVNPDGRYLNREEALAWVNANGNGVRPSGNMLGQLDALDYRDQSRIAAGASRTRDRIDISKVPPPPAGSVPYHGDFAPIGERPPLRSDRPFRPENVVPVPGNRVADLEEARALPSSVGPIEGPPALGRTPKRPEGFDAYMRARLRAESAERGVTVRIDAEDAIDKGVPADLVYHNPGVVDRTKLRLRNPGIFGTRYGQMTSKQQVLRSLDMDDVDPVEWGFEDRVAAGRLEPEDIGDLLRRGLEGDPSALRRGSQFDAWAAHQQRGADRTEFESHYPDGPPFEERGQAVGPDDLDALTPPLSAYEDSPRLVGRVGNLNLERIDNPQEVTRLVQHIRANVSGIDDARRGVISNEETRRLAQELAVSDKQLIHRLLARNPGGGLPPPEEMFAYRVLVQQGRQKVASLARRARGASDADVARFHNVVMKQAALEQQLAGVGADAGRVVQQYNMIAGAGDASDAAIKAYLRGAGGRETVEDMADRIINLVEDPAAAGRFIQRVAKVRKRDMLNELWIASLLSGPKTHIVNSASNALTSLYSNIGETAVAAVVGRATGAKDRAFLREIGPRIVGMIEGAREGLPLMRQAWKTGEPADMVTRVEAVNYQAIPGKLGHRIRTPMRALTAADEFWKSVNRRAEINGQAFRRAFHEPGTTAERMARFNELRQAPDKKMRDQGDEWARYLTFQKPLGKAGQGVQQFANDFPGAKLFIPFVRTPANLIKFAGERSPFALASPHFWRAMREGGHKRAEAIARITMGSGISAWAVAEAFDGNITGGLPTDRAEAAALLNSGWQPYSFKVGNQWVSYQRFEPISLLVGAAADFAALGTYAKPEEADRFAMSLAMAVAQNITSKTWLSGLSDFFDALSDPERNAERVIRRLASSAAVPAIVAHAAQAIDPNIREANTILDAIRARVPGVSMGLAPRLTVWGDEMDRPTTGVPPVDFISPVNVKEQTTSPLLLEVARLKAALPMPQRSIRSHGVSHRLTDEQYRLMVELSGRPAREYLEGFVQSDEWRNMDDDTKREFLKETLEDYRAMARGDLKARFPELDAPPPEDAGPARRASRQRPPMLPRPGAGGPSGRPMLLPPPRSSPSTIPPPPPGAVPYGGP